MSHASKQRVAAEPPFPWLSQAHFGGLALGAPAPGQLVPLGPGGTETVAHTISLGQQQVAPSNLLAAGRSRR